MIHPCKADMQMTGDVSEQLLCQSCVMIVVTFGQLLCSAEGSDIKKESAQSNRDD